MEIKKENINLTGKGVSLTSNVCVDGDIIAPDTKPDIAEVLLADANAVTQSVEYRGGTLVITGMVFFKILYRPDSENVCGLKSLSASLPFTDSVDAPGKEHLKFSVKATTEHIGFTLVNSRKLSAKAIVSLCVTGYSNRDIEPISEILGDDIQCKTARHQIYLPVAREQSEFRVSDFLTVPADKPDIDEILKVDAWATAGEEKIMNGKVMVKGTLHVRTLYTSAEDGNDAVLVPHEIPFTEIVEAENVDENCAVYVTFSVEDITATARGDMNGDTKIISAEFLLEATVHASKVIQENVVDDCYSTKCNLDVVRERVNLLEYVTSERASFVQTQRVELPKKATLGEIVSVTCKPILRSCGCENGMMHVNGTLVSFLLYREEKGDKKVSSVVTETDFAWKKDIVGEGATVECDLWLDNAVAAKTGANGAEVTATLGLFAKALREKDVEIITEMAETERKDVKKTCLMVYFVQDGDTLWEIAKRYGTTVQSIKSANEMETDDLLSGRKILIPKAC